MKNNNSLFKKQLTTIHKHFTSAGFTLMELVIVIAILFIISSFITISLINQQRTTSLNSSIDVLMSDISSQQTKSMTGLTNSATDTSNYGIYFLDDRYILFKGTSYSEEDPANFTVMLDKDIEFSNISFPGSNIIFSSISGEITGFLDGSNSVTVQDVSGGTSKTIIINRYGVVENIY